MCSKGRFKFVHIIIHFHPRHQCSYSLSNGFLLFAEYKNLLLGYLYIILMCSKGRFKFVHIIIHFHPRHQCSYSLSNGFLLFAEYKNLLLGYLYIILMCSKGRFKFVHIIIHFHPRYQLFLECCCMKSNPQVIVGFFRKKICYETL